MGISGQTAIAGIGVTPFGKLPGRSAWSLQTEAARNALEDAGRALADMEKLAVVKALVRPAI